MRSLLILCCFAVIFITTMKTPAAITVHNYYRMGENDPGATGVSLATQDSVGSKHLTTSGGPFYATDVSTEATTRVSSSLSMNFFSGGPYASGVLLSNITDNFALEAWVKPTTTSGSHCIVYNGNTGSSGWGIMQYGDRFKALFGGMTIFGDGLVTAGSWTHVALVRNGGNATLYVNGVAAGSTTSAPNPPVGAFAVAVSPPDMNFEFLAGYVDEVRFSTFPYLQFSTNDLLRRAPDVAVQQPVGSTINNGGSQNFGSANAGSSTSLTFTIANTGLSDLTGLNITIDGTHATSFSVTSGPGAIVAAGGSTTFTVRFAPTTGGANVATLHLASNDPDENPYNITLTGQGTVTQPPTVSTLAGFSGAFSSNGNLFASVNGNNADTTVAFEYGPTTTYGSVAIATNLPASANLVTVSKVLTGLAPGTLYHFRVVATNGAGTSFGVDRTFTTRNDNLEVWAHYRMGEFDGANYTAATAGSSELVRFTDIVGDHHLQMANDGSFPNDPPITAQPVYSTNVGVSAASDTGSFRSVNFLEGKAYGFSPVFYSGIDNFCLEAWVKAETPAESPLYVLHNGSEPNGYGIMQKNGKFIATMSTTRFANFQGQDFGGAPVVFGEWTHLALVSSGGTATFYVNGVATGNASRPLNLIGGDFTVGKGPIFQGEYRFGGYVDEVRLSTFPSGQFSVTNLLFRGIPPAVTDPTSASITFTSAVLGGTITSNGGTPVTERGIVYSAFAANGNPVIGGSGVTKVVAAGSAGTFTIPVTGLTPSTYYAFRAYAINTGGATYSPVATFASGFTPMVHYRMGEIDPGASAGASATNTLDSAGTNHLPLTGSATYSADVASDQVGIRSLNFGSGSAYGTRALWPAQTNNFGFEAWVKPSTGSGSHIVFYNGNPGSSGWGVLQSGNTYQVLFGGQVLFGAGPVTVNQWTHLAMVRENGVSTLYVNRIAAGTTTVAPALPTGGFALGANPGNLSQERWAGNMDEVRLFVFPPGQFSFTNLLLFSESEIVLEQPAGTELLSGGNRDFGSVQVGNNANLSFIIRNTGDANLTGLVPTVSGPHASQFTVTASPTAPVAPGGSTTFTVRFTPTSFGNKSATLNISNNDRNENPFSILLSGSGVGPEIVIEQPAGTDLADGGGRNFGSVNVGANTTLTFALVNNGNSDLVLNGTPRVVVSGAHASDFTVTIQPASPVTSSVLTLTNGGFEVPSYPPNGFTYNPSGSGWTIGSKAGIARNGSPWFVNSSPEGIQAAFIQLNSADAYVSRTINFATAGNYLIRFSLVRRGSGFEANDVDVRMDGITLGSISHTNQMDDTWRTFTVPYNCLAPGNHTLAFVGTRGGADNASALDGVQILGGTTFQVTFAPTATAGGVRTAELSIANNDSDENPFNITLTGTGIPVPEIAVFTGAGTAPNDERTNNAGTHVFASTPVGSNSVTQTFTIKNVGGTNLTGLALSKSGLHAGDFILGTLGATTLAPNATTTFTVTFSPNASGERSATVSIVSNDQDENPFQINVSGDDLVPEIAVFTGESTAAGDERTNNVGTHVFTAIGVGGHSALQTFTIKNVGSANLTGLAISMTGTNSGDFTAGGLEVTSLAPNATATFTVGFNPTAAGARTATVNIQSNDGDEDPFAINISGTGVNPFASVDTQSLTLLSNGHFQFTFVNTNNLTFSVLATTNVGLPSSNWMVLGPATNIGGGIYQFTDEATTNFPSRFYQLRFP